MLHEITREKAAEGMRSIPAAAVSGLLVVVH
jgi:hypothetical protein